MMRSHAAPGKDDLTKSEAAGYTLGVLFCLFREILRPFRKIMPIRMWLTVIASVALVSFVNQSESVILIVRAFCAYAALIAILIGSAVYKRKWR